MATSSPTSAASRSPHRPIRVVPLRVDDGLVAPAPAAPPSPAPSLTYRGGPLLTAVQVFTLFWGDGWQGEPQAAVMQQLIPVSYTHLRAHETRHDLVCRLLLEK